MTTPPPLLFEPLQLGELTLANRFVMSPMTRHRATVDGLPTDLAVEYYRQRATAGLIVTEGTYPSSMGKGYLFTPGICTSEQVDGWRRVTDAVHKEGGHIFCQLMHCGRLSDPLLLPGQADPVAPSAIQPSPDGLYTLDCPRAQRPYPRPRALTTSEVYLVIEEYRIAAQNAFAAGFDGVEIHCGNGYLPMQFLATNVNHRDDEFGGSVENRCRFLIALVDAVATVHGPDRIGMRLHPGQNFAGVHDEDPVATCHHLIPELSRRRVGYLHVSLRPVGFDVVGTMRTLYDGPIIAGGGLYRSRAAHHLSERTMDLASFGQAFIANPDLVERYRNGWTVTRPDRATYYTQGSEGYTDYPVFANSDPSVQLSPDSSFASALPSE